MSDLRLFLLVLLNQCIAMTTQINFSTMMLVQLSGLQKPGRGASDHEEGFYSVWCHVGNGDNDYSGGPYQGGFYAEAASADVAFEQPTPYFSHSFINGSCQHCGRDAADPRIDHSYGPFTCGDDTHVGRRCLVVCHN